MKPKRIVIDAGHGGTDPGAVGWVPHSPDIAPKREVDQALAIAAAVAAELDRRGYDVVMTRTADRYMQLQERVMFVNALKPQAALVISLHRDAAASANAQGLTVFYNNMGNKPSVRGKRLAEILQRHLVQRTGLTDRSARPRPAFRDGKQVETSLAILRDTKPPAALVELGFMSHPTEELLADDPNFRRSCALAIAGAVDEYFR